MAEMFDGAAKAEVKTLQGALSQAGNAVGDLGESFGRLLEPMATAGAGMVKDFSEKASRAFDFVGAIDWGETFSNMSNNLKALGTGLVDTLKVYIDFIPDFWKNMWSIVSNNIWPLMKKGFDNLWNGIKAYMKFMYEPTWIALQLAVKIMHRELAEFSAHFKNVFIAMVQFGQEQWNKLAALDPTGMMETVDISEKIIVSGITEKYNEEINKLKEDLMNTDQIKFLQDVLTTDDIQNVGDASEAVAEIWSNLGAKIISTNKEIEKSEDDKNKKSAKGTQTQIKAKKELTEKEIAGYAKTSGTAEDAMKSVVKAEGMEAVAGLISSILKTVPFPFNAILAAGAGATASSLIDKGLASFAEGSDFVTNGKQLIMVGDNPSGQERVQITPLGGDPAPNAPTGSSVTLNISAPLVDDTVVDSIIPAINEALRRGETLAI